MSFTETGGTTGLDARLLALPVDRVTASQGSARLVIGANGAFVIVPADHDGGTAAISAAARLAHDLAETTRRVLVQHLGLAPFLDALVTVRARRCPTSSALATLVPLDLIGEILAEGPTQVGDAALARIAELIAEGRLDGWAPGVGTTPARIDLCEPPKRTATTPRLPTR